MGDTMIHRLALPELITAGRGSIAELSDAADRFGHRALLVTGASGRFADRVAEALEQSGVSVTPIRRRGEPTVDDVRAGVAAARNAHCELVVAVGGGSVMDAGKAIAAIAGCGGDPLDYLETVGAGKPLHGTGLPCIAIPTTAGTGAEVTRNAVLGSPAHGVKASLRGPQLLPRWAIVDADLTDGTPAEITSFAGMDACTQLLEAFTSRRANPLTDPYCLQGLLHVSGSITLAAEEDVPAARDAMALASLYGGIALANAGLGAVHGIAGPLGGMIEAPHGAICAALVARVTAANVRAATELDPDSPILDRYATAAAVVTDDPDMGAEDVSEWLSELAARLEIPTLSHWGAKPEMAGEVVAKAMAANSMKSNPVPLSEGELQDIYLSAL